MLTKGELTRYHRQIIFPDFGVEGQEKLKKAHVLIAGVGGLGSPAAIYLACAGVGKITKLDSDPVELSNLNRQILHWEDDIGQQKVLSAKKKLQRMNSTADILPMVKRLDTKNASALLEGMTVAVDCLDNFETRFILNEACIRNNVPLIHGGINGFKGEVTTILPGRTPCLRCLFPHTVKEKGPVPVFGATAALVASIQVLEAIKLISGLGKLLTGRILYIHASEMTFFTLKYKKIDDCEICGIKS